MAKRTRMGPTRNEVVGVLIAVIGVGGAIAGAIIAKPGAPERSSDRASSTEPAQPNIAITAVAFDRRKDGGELVSVKGTARELAPGDGVYALARPHRAADSPDADAAWFASDGAKPDQTGVWLATITVDAHAAHPLEVVAAQIAAEELAPSVDPPASDEQDPTTASALRSAALAARQQHLPEPAATSTPSVAGAPDTAPEVPPVTASSQPVLVCSNEPIDDLIALCAGALRPR